MKNEHSTKHKNLTNLAKFELYKEKFPLNGGKSPTNASLAASYGVDRVLGEVMDRMTD
ncbi:hypothetical protein L873DRAFT_1431224 [Choiromyces venosus 120613-1]|uniref:Uncharacterized protein n=1 Tax=Choiromyces venosus 120613-1 TaxID=1336337 RepID=A0A3N4J8C6_9PEZI|nr:hypothetical protein L873DRAFT_1431224 [Choiromyces venosus 120613-1]